MCASGLGFCFQFSIHTYFIGFILIFVLIARTNTAAAGSARRETVCKTRSLLFCSVRGSARKGNRNTVYIVSMRTRKAFRIHCDRASVMAGLLLALPVFYRSYLVSPRFPPSISIPFSLLTPSLLLSPTMYPPQNIYNHIMYIIFRMGNVAAAN